MKLNLASTSFVLILCQIVIQPDSVFGPNGTLLISVQLPTSVTVSLILKMEYYDNTNNLKNVSGLMNPIVFVLPLIKGAATPIQACLGEHPEYIVPSCSWYDSVDGAWKTSGCTTKLFETEIQCSCSHLTDFAAVLPTFNHVPLKQVLALTSENIATHPGGMITVMVVLAFFGLFVVIGLFRDRQEKQLEEMLRSKKLEKWGKADASNAEISLRKQWWKQYKTGLQLRHTWGSILFRKSGTTFRSVDRAVVTLLLVFILMSMSARFHDRNQNFFGRAQIIIFNILASLLPSLILTHLFLHTGDLGFYEKWQIQQGITTQSKYRVLRYRFAERWRYVWYGVVLAAVLSMVVYILSIALMFDQNPIYYCQGTTTGAWVVDFTISYAVSVMIIEPFKILFFVTSKSLIQTVVERKSTVQASVLEGCTRTMQT